MHYSFRLFSNLLLVLSMVGCAVAPTRNHVIVNRERLEKVERMLILVPEIGNHGARVPSRSQSGALTAALSEESVNRVKNSKDEIMARVPPGRPDREFAAALKSEMEKQNFHVSIHLPDEPELTDFAQYDAVMAVSIMADYSAAGFANPFTRDVRVTVEINSIRDGKRAERLAFSQFRYMNRANDKFQYLTYESLLKDAPKAVTGLRKAVIELVPEIGKTFSKKAPS